MIRLVSSILLISSIYTNCLGQKGEREKITHAVTTFFKWYIATTKDKRYSTYVRPVRNEEGMTKLETVLYFKQLDSLGVISNEFVKDEMERFRPCNDFLKTQSWQEFSSADEFSAEDQCGFLYYYYWTGGHEPYDGVNVGNVQIKKNSATALANLYTGKNKTAGPSIVVHLKKEKRKWVITEIEK